MQSGKSRWRHGICPARVCAVCSVLRPVRGRRLTTFCPGGSCHTCYSLARRRLIAASVEVGQRISRTETTLRESGRECRRPGRRRQITDAGQVGQPASSGAAGDLSSSRLPCCSMAPRCRRWALPRIFDRSRSSCSVDCSTLSSIWLIDQQNVARSPPLEAQKRFLAGVRAWTLCQAE